MSEKEYLFTTIYVKYYSPVYIKIKKRLYSKIEDDITSCVQETFIKAWRNMGDLRAHKNVGGWLIKCAEGVAGNFNKKYALRRKKSADISEIEKVEDGTDFAQDIVETAEFEKYIESHAIDKFLEQLSEDERALYGMKYMQKLSNEEIGKILGITANAVASRNKRLVQKFKKEYLLFT